MSSAVPALQIDAPALDGLTVHVPTLPAVSEGELVARFEERMRALATTRDRSEGEAIGWGDDLRIDVVAGCEGRLIPFSTRFDWWVLAAPQSDVPGLFEALIGEPVGATVRVELTLPPSYPVEALRSKRARFVVTLHEAKEVAPLPASEFARTGLGQTLRAVMLALRAELEHERETAQLHLARELAFDAVLERAKVALPVELIDDDIRRAWGRGEGQLLKARGFSQQELDESLEGWLTDRPTRIASERRVALSLIFRAVVEREQLVLTREGFEAVLLELGDALGLDEAAIAAGLRESSELTGQMAELGIHLLGMQHVLQQVELTS